jgi:DNA invertase Pin-like site-specific DNA recombinase
MLLGYMRVSADGDPRFSTYNAMQLLAVGVDERHLFEDHAGGSRCDRAGRLPGDVEAGSPRSVVAPSASRVNGLKERGIAFRSLTEQIDTTTPQGEFLFLAQFERSLARERVKAGLAAARRRGGAAAAGQ